MPGECLAAARAAFDTPFFDLSPLRFTMIARYLLTTRCTIIAICRHLVLHRRAIDAAQYDFMLAQELAAFAFERGSWLYFARLLRFDAFRLQRYYAAGHTVASFSA